MGRTSGPKMKGNNLEWTGKCGEGENFRR